MINRSNVKSTTKKRAKAVLSVFLVVAILIAGAYAFLSATDSKTNVFTVGNVDIELHEIFNGSDYGKGEDPGAIGDKIENIVPGQSIEKAPYVVNTGKNPAYTFIAVGIPTDTADNVYNGQGTYTAKSELDIKVKAYAIQQQYNGATDAESTWANYFKKDMISGTASDAGIELFTLNNGTSAVATGTHTIGSDWQEFSAPYSVTDGGNTYTYHFFKYVANNELLPVGTTTAHLFDKVVFNENIGGDTPPEPVTINYLLPEDDTDTLAGYAKLEGGNIPDGYYLFRSESYMPGDLIKQPPFDNSFSKTGESFSWVNIDTKEQIIEGEKIGTKAIYAIPSYRKITANKESDFLTYCILQSSNDTFFAEVCGADSSHPNYPKSATDVIVPTNIYLTKTDGEISLLNGCLSPYNPISDSIKNQIEEGKTYCVPVTAIRGGQLSNLEMNETESALVNITKVLIAPDSVHELNFTNSNVIEKAYVPCGTSFAVDDDGHSITNSFSFEGCTSLKSVDLSDSLTTISYNGFLDCALEEIKIPASVKNVYGQAFAGCDNLRKVYYDSLFDYLSTDFIDEQWSNPLFLNHSNERQVKLYINNELLSGEVKIPLEIKKIPNNAFCGCLEIDSVVLHDNITNIGINAFYNVLNVQCGYNTQPLVENSSGWLGINKYVSGDFSFEDESHSILSAVRAGLKEINIPSSVTHVSTKSLISYGPSVPAVYNLPSSLLYVENYLLVSSPATINYAGTISQLESLLEAADAYWAFGGTTVHCSDGDSRRPTYC